MTKEDLLNLSIEQPDMEYARICKNHWDSIAKPLDSMGEFEKIGAKIASILRDERLDIKKRALLVLCSDNGIVEEGVSQSKQEITYQVAKLLGERKSSVCIMAKQAEVDVIPVDIGINQEKNIQGVLPRKIIKGTKNFRKFPAMSQEECISAIEVGMKLVKDLKEQGYRILAIGEMGIGNTTTSTAVAAALLKDNAENLTGRGAGLSDEGLKKKVSVINEAIKKYDLYHADALSILESVGGLDIAGFCGVCIGAARYHIPVVLDGVISVSAALLAERICPGVREYLLASHLGKEPSMVHILEELQLNPVIHGNLALGEGSGAVMLFPLLDTAFSLYHNAVSFQEAEIVPYERFT